MATVGDLNILLGGDATNFTNAIKSGEKNLVDLARALIATGKDIEKFNLGMLNVLAKNKTETGRIAQSLIKDLNVISKGLVDQGKAVTTNQAGIRNLSAEQIVLTKTTKEAALAQQELAKQQMAADKATQNFINGIIKQAQQRTKDFERSINAVSYSLFLMDRGLQQLGTTLSITFTAPIVAAGTLATKTFTDFEKGTTAIQAAADISRQSADNITSSFVKISQSVPLAVSELQKAAYAAGQAGVSGEEAIVNFSEAAVKLSKVGGDALKDLPIEDLSNNLAKLSIAFGVAGDNMEQVTNVASTLLAVGKAIPGGLGELIEAMRRASGVAADYGASLQQASAFTGTLVAAAIPASRAGTELSRVFIEMSRNAETLAEFLGYTGDQFEGFKGRLEGDISGVLVEFVDRLSLVESSLERDAVAAQIFGEVGAKAFRPLVNNPEILAGLLEVANYEMERGTLLARDFAIQSDNLASTFQVFKNNVQALAEILGRDLAPYVAYVGKLFIQVLASAIEGWRNLDPLIKTLVISFAALTATVGPLVLLFKTLFLSPIVGIVTFISSIYRLTQALGVLVPLMITTNGSLELLQAQALGGIVGMEGLAAAMLTTSAASTTLLTRIAALAIPFAEILIVVGAVAAALYGLSKALGISFKLPSFKTPQIPELKPPEINFSDLSTKQQDEQDRVTQEELKKEEKRLNDEEKALRKQIKDRQKLRKQELRSIEQNIKDFEKSRKAELKALQNAVDDQKDLIDKRKDLWEEENNLEQEKIDAQEETLSVAKDTLKTAKDALNDIKKVQKGEVDAAEGRADLAKSSLRAAQEALKREVILGRDEYDATFRAADERVKAAQNALQLAEENVVRVKREYEKQIQAQEEVVNAAEDQVDIQQNALDDLKSALEQRKKIVDKEIDLLGDELKVRQDALDDYRDSSQEKLDILNEERDAIRQDFDDELDALNDRLDAIKEQSQAIKDLPQPELPDTVKSIEDFQLALQKQLQKIRDVNIEAFKTEGTTDFGIDPGGPTIQEGGALSNWLKAWEEAKKQAEETGGDPIKIFTAAAINEMTTQGVILEEAFSDFVFGAIFGEENWTAIEEEAARRGVSPAKIVFESFSDTIAIYSSRFGDTVLKAMFGEENWRNIEEEAATKGVSPAQVIWDSFTAKTTELWTGLKEFIINTIFGEGTWSSLDGESSNKGIGLADALWKGLKEKGQEIYGQVQTFVTNNIISPITNLFGLIFGTGESAGSQVEGGLESGGEGTLGIGSNIIDNFIRGLRNYGGLFGVFGNIRTAIYNNLGTLSGDAWRWGHNLIESLKNGMESARRFLVDTANSIGDALRRLWESNSPPKEGVLRNIDKWGEGLVKTFADSMKAAAPDLSNAVDSLNQTIQNSIGDIPLENLTITPSIVGGIGSNIAANADIASIPSLTREADLAQQQQQNTPQIVNNRTYNIQPGQMIATRGEVRNFVRMINEYEKVENQR